MAGLSKLSRSTSIRTSVIEFYGRNKAFHVGDTSTSCSHWLRIHCGTSYLLRLLPLVLWMVPLTVAFSVAYASNDMWPND
jgi:hypothetical protein